MSLCAIALHDVSYVTAPSTGGSSLKVVNGARARAHSGTRVGMSHPDIMGQECSYALFLNQHDKAFCTQTVNGISEEELTQAA